MKNLKFFRKSKKLLNMLQDIFLFLFVVCMIDSAVILHLNKNHGIIMYSISFIELILILIFGALRKTCDKKIIRIYKELKIPKKIAA